MIRDKDKIYGEVNDPNTVVATGTLQGNKLLLGSGNKGVKTYNPNAKCIPYLNADGTITNLPFTKLGPYKVVGTDNNGNLTALLNRAMGMIGFPSPGYIMNIKINDTTNIPVEIVSKLNGNLGFKIDSASAGTTINSITLTLSQPFAGATMTCLMGGAVIKECTSGTNTGKIANVRFISADGQNEVRLVPENLTADKAMLNGLFNFHGVIVGLWSQTDMGAKNYNTIKIDFVEPITGDEFSYDFAITLVIGSTYASTPAIQTNPVISM